MPRRGSTEEAAQRRQDAMQLRMAGLSYRAIGAQLGVSEAQAHRDVKAELQKLAKQTEKETREYRQMQLEQINTLLTGLWPLARPRRVTDPDTGATDVIPPDQGAVDRIMRLLERQARLLALDLQPDKDDADKTVRIVVEYADRKDRE